MSDWQIACASIAALVARMNTLALDLSVEAKAERVAIQREIQRRLCA